MGSCLGIVFMLCFTISLCETILQSLSVAEARRGSDRSFARTRTFHDVSDLFVVGYFTLKCVMCYVRWGIKCDYQCTFIM